MRIAVILLLATALPAWAGQTRLPDREQEGLSGPVRTVTIEVERPSDGAIRRDRLETLTFATSGDLTERVVYSGADVVARLTYHYDDKGYRHISSTSRDGVGLGIPPTRLRPRENPAIVLSQSADGTYAFCATAGYSAGGRLIEERVFAGDDPTKGGMLSRTIYRFNGTVLPSEMLLFAGWPERTVTRETYTYGTDGRLSESFSYGPSNVLPVKTVYTYELDDRGNWITRIETTTLNGVPSVTTRHRTITYFDRPAPVPR
ncbi:MAG TPA: hypothetical protein PLF26_02030 [Blastocatellia bacterium]|nr:hypothetical protein [Blastocatellia bacterium]